MPLSISGLRRWFAAGAIGLVLVVAAVYFYARHRVQNALKEVPAKIGIEIQQSAQGFTVSRSEQGHTLFKVQARKAVQFKQGGRAELHDVTITLYGRDSSRFDQIYGADFEFDPQSGDVLAKGEVQMDLEANPEGLTHPDQAAPKELKNPIHLTTTNLLFNQKTGNASTKEKVEFSIPEANGSAVGLNYVADTAILTLHSQVDVDFHGATPARLTAVSGTISKNPRVVLLELPHLENADRRATADKGTLFLRPDNSVERILAVGNVRVESRGVSTTKAQSNQLELLMAAQSQETLRTATFSGDVRMVNSGTQPMQGNAGLVVMNFTGNNVLTTVHSQEMSNCCSISSPATPPPARRTSRSQRRPSTLWWPTVAGSSVPTLLERPKLPFAPSRPPAGRPWSRPASFMRVSTIWASSRRYTAPRTLAWFRKPRASPTGSAPARCWMRHFIPAAALTPSCSRETSPTMTPNAKPGGNGARYTPADQMLVLTGSPRIIDGGMTTTARTMRLNRATGDGLRRRRRKEHLQRPESPAQWRAAGFFRSDSRERSSHDGTQQLLRSRSTPGMPGCGRTPTLSRRPRSSSTAIAARLWRVDRLLNRCRQCWSKRRKSGKVTPVKITSARFSYTDAERTAHFEGDVQAKSSDLTITAREMDVFLQAREQQTGDHATPNQSVAGASAGIGKIDHIIAREQVVITQPTRKATGELLVYTAADDKFVLSGGTPSIFDAERGKITGVSLTLFRHDDRVLVEGDNTSPTVTQTRVAR